MRDAKHAAARYLFQSCKRRIAQPNHRGRTLQSKNSRTRQHKSEVMKHKTKNRKPAQQSKKGNTQAKSPSLMQEKTAACFSLLYSLDSQTIKPIARQNIKKSPDIKKMQMKNEFSVSRFRFHPNKSETVAWKENENKSRATSKWKRTLHKNSTCA